MKDTHENMRNRSHHRSSIHSPVHMYVLVKGRSQSAAHNDLICTNGQAGMTLVALMFLKLARRLIVLGPEICTHNANNCSTVKLTQYTKEEKIFTYAWADSN